MFINRNFSVFEMKTAGVVKSEIHTFSLGMLPRYWNAKQCFFLKQIQLFYLCFYNGTKYIQKKYKISDLTEGDNDKNHYSIFLFDQ